jgi:hypothetical protein
MLLFRAVFRLEDYRVESSILTNDEEWKANCGDLPWSMQQLYDKTIHLAALKLTGGISLDNFIDPVEAAGGVEEQEGADGDGSALEAGRSGILSAKSGVSAYVYNPEDEGELLPELEGELPRRNKSDEICNLTVDCATINLFITYQYL